MVTLPDDYLRLITGAVYAAFGTTSPDGTPHQTITWLDYDGDHLLINTSSGRRKVKNVRQNPRVSVNVMDPDDPHTYITIAGTVTEITTEEADTHATQLGRQYGELSEDESFADVHGDGDRLILRIRPTNYFTH